MRKKLNNGKCVCVCICDAGEKKIINAMFTASATNECKKCNSNIHDKDR